MSKFKIGDCVIIQGITTILKTSLSDIDGGWLVLPPVQGVCYWNENEMTKETKANRLIRRLFESDEANALTNEAARFIEKMLK